MKPMTIKNLIERICNDACEWNDAQAILDALCDGAYLGKLMKHYQVERSTGDDDDVTPDERVFCALIETAYRLVEMHGVSLCKN